MAKRFSENRKRLSRDRRPSQSSDRLRAHKDSSGKISSRSDAFVPKKSAGRKVRRRRKASKNYIPIIAGLAGVAVIGGFFFFMMSATSPEDFKKIKIPGIETVFNDSKLPKIDIKKLTGPDAEKAILATNNWSAAHEGIVRNFVKQGRDIGASEKEILTAWNALEGTSFAIINNSNDRAIKTFIRRYMKK